MSIEIVIEIGSRGVYANRYSSYRSKIVSWPVVRLKEETNMSQSPIRLHYFPGRGRAESTRWMLAANALEFEQVLVSSASAFADLRATGNLPFGQLPLLEIDGLHLTQSAAMTRYLARRGDFYGDTAEDAVWCDMIAGATADFAEVALKCAFQPSEAEAIASLEQALAKYGPHFERRLKANGGEWIAAKRMTFADVLLAEPLTANLEWAPGILDRWQGLKDLQARVTSHAGIARYLSSANRWHRPDAEYVVNVGAILQRALPPHFPDANRFVVAG